MIKTDQFLLADLVSLLLQGKELNVEQEILLRKLMEKYPSARNYVVDMIESGKVISPINLDKIDVQVEWDKFQHDLRHHDPQIRSFWSKWRSWGYVAALLILFGSVTVLWYSKHNEDSFLIEDNVYGQLNDILPASELAFFETKNKEGVAIKTINELTQLESTNNLTTLRVPIRANFNLLLSDGSKVWLSPESDLEYLPQFSTHERRLKLRGEAFFEVAKDANRPFIVEVDGMVVKALGTAFSVTSYRNNPKVILAEGKLQLNTLEQVAVINAGFQGTIANNVLVTQQSENIADALAIKERVFNFNNKNIKEILEEVQRWYGIELKIDTELSPKRYVGNVERNITLAKLCVVLQDLTGLQFSIQRNNLIIK